MNDLQRKEIAKILLITAHYYGREVSHDVLAMIVEDLADLPFETVKAALTHYRKTSTARVLPTVAQIRQLVSGQNKDPRMQAVDYASRITKAVSAHGYTNAQGAKDDIGQVGWEVVRRLGGWTYLCENLGTPALPLATINAQARDMAQSMIVEHESFEQIEHKESAALSWGGMSELSLGNSLLEAIES